MNFIFLPENALFLITFALILLFGLVEILAMIFGMSVFSHADTWLSPHIYAGDSLFSQGLDWLNIGKVPLLILCILCCPAFHITEWFKWDCCTRWANLLRRAGGIPRGESLCFRAKK